MQEIVLWNFYSRCSMYLLFQHGRQIFLIASHTIYDMGFLTHTYDILLVSGVDSADCAVGRKHFASQSQKYFFLSKKPTNKLQISALASKSGRIKKIKELYYTNNLGPICNI